MKRQDIIIAVFLFISLQFTAQTTVVSDLESFNLSADTFLNGLESPLGLIYQDGIVNYQNYFDTSFGGFWTGGFAISTHTDTVDTTFNNLFSAKPGKGYNGSNTYAVGQPGAPGGVAKLTQPNGLNGPRIAKGAYVTLGTFGFDVIKKGNGFSRKFGDTTGTNCNCPQGSYPDYFKLSVSGWRNGQNISDTVEFMLADYRFLDDSLDFIIDDWVWMDLSAIGAYDSLWFDLFSTDTNQFGMNTPNYFFMDDFTYDEALSVLELDIKADVKVFPNPANGGFVNVSINGELKEASLYNSIGQEIERRRILGIDNFQLDIDGLKPGIYYLRLKNDQSRITKKIIVE
jgi:hypothetical protein